MTKLLRLDSSIFGSAGASTQLNDQLVATLKNQYPDLEVTHRDLAGQPLPHYSADFIAALGKEPQLRTPEEQTQVALADALIRELRDADLLVVGAPMYNFSVPTTLKTWMDYVARAGETFKYTRSGAVGLLSDTRVYINTSRGGLHRDKATDGVAPLLSHFFTLLGLTDITVVYAEGLNVAGRRDQALADARQSISRLAARESAPVSDVLTEAI